MLAGDRRSLHWNRPQGPAGVSVTARDGIARLARQLMVGSGQRAAVACAEELIGGQAVAARIACGQRTARQVQARARPFRPLPNARPDDRDRGKG